MDRRRPRRLRGHNYHLQSAYFVTFCTKNREHAFSVAENAQIAVDALLLFEKKRRVQLIAYCIMPDHIHVYFKKLDTTNHLSRIVAGVKSYITKRVSGSFGWQRGYWDEIIRSFEDPGDVVAYILNNPVCAGIVEDYREYKYSGPPDRAKRAD